MAALSTGEHPPAQSETSRATGASDAASKGLAKLAEAIAAQPARPAYSQVVISGLVRMAEFIVLTTVGFGVYYLYIGPQTNVILQYVASVPIISLAAVIGFQAMRLYTTSAFLSPLSTGLRLATVWTAVLAATIAISFLIKLDTPFSRVWLTTWWLTGAAALLLERRLVFLTHRSLMRKGVLERRTVVVGGGPAGERLLRDLSRQNDSELKIYGVFDDRTDERSPDMVAGFPKLGKVDDLVTFARTTRLDLIIFALPITAEQRILAMLRKLCVLPVDIRLAAHSNQLRLRPRSYSYIGDVPVLDIFDKPIADWDVVIKTLFDKIIGSLALLILSPIFLVTAIAIKLESRGPVFFRQKRYGFNNELVEVWKFRSMYVDQLDHSASKLVTKDDPRVTRVGRFIRKTSIDELPQLINVVFGGALSLVGPRPHAVHAKAADREYDQVVESYFARHRVRPGITGWAQVNGWRGETDTPEKIQQRVEHDLYYIENWSIFFDIYILAITPFALIKTENAY